MTTINGIPVLSSIPKGWKVIPGATMAPRGYVFIGNGKSRFARPSEYRHALVPIEVANAMNTARLAQ